MYYIVYYIFYLISLLPLRILYIIADGIYGIVYYIARYRRKVVMKNLTLAFPEKTAAEKKAIAKKFYHNLVDSFVEIIKMFSASDRFMLKHFTGNWDFINEFHKTGKNCQVLLGHTFNWEWANYAFARQANYKFLCVYMPIANKIFDRLFLAIRKRGGTIMLPANDMRRGMMAQRGTQYALALAADQSPTGHPKAYWLEFFGHRTGFLPGPEKGARAGNTPVIFADIEKKRRGYYHLTLSMGEENPAGTKEGEITLKYAKYLENMIRRHPDMWLWSHKRWKHEWKPEYKNAFFKVQAEIF